MNYCSYLQSKGRARAQNSKYIVLTSDEDRAVTETDLSAYIAMDDTLKKTCLERSVPDAGSRKCISTTSHMTPSVLQDRAPWSL